MNKEEKYYKEYLEGKFNQDIGIFEPKEDIENGKRN